MAQLSFDGVQPVNFYDKEAGHHRACQPKLTQPLKMRLAGTSFDTEAQSEEAYEILADCFPDDREFVLNFIKNEMLGNDAATLKNYLLNGAEGIKAQQSAYDAVGAAISEIVHDKLKEIDGKA